MSTDPAIAGAPASLDAAASSDALQPTAFAAAAAPTTGETAVDVTLDRTRRDIAYLLLWIMIGVMLVIILASVVYSVRCAMDSTTCAAATNALGVLTSSISPIFTAMVGLVGSVVGFYFGSKQAAD